MIYIYINRPVIVSVCLYGRRLTGSQPARVCVCPFYRACAIYFTPPKSAR